MKISERALGMTTSPIRRLGPYAEAAVKAGKKIYRLNIGQPDIATSPKFMEAIRDFDQKVVAYGNSQGDMNLIKAIQKYYDSWNMHYETKNIFVTNGGSEALELAVFSLCDPGDEILVFEPYYANYTTFAKLASAKVTAVPTSAEDGYRLPDKATVEKYINEKTRAILLTNPGNPTGVVYNKQEMDMIAEIVKKYNIALIADEVYREFVYDGTYTSFGTYKDLDQNLIMIDSVSKRYSACGARIGCVLSKNDELCAQFMKLCQARLCAPTVEQIGAAALYDTPVSYLEEVNKEYKKRRDTIAAGLARIPGLVSSQPKGAFYVMVKFPVDDAEKFAIWMLQDFEKNGETVMIAPGNGFYATPGKGVDEARLAYVLNCEDLERAMELLAAAVKEYPGRTI
ncbi:MAG: pyridoxal phosphate-dependent aminotransferase [Succiniclasticum sp.]|uniref:pyridoxal phosphate-dependent aminotransferase n=1 Tax=Succiniclasticum sp. TaxID=2775030 RepID=UPI002A91E07A|nr:pyridoxal phosphate-dependent aminotransferase [Succiniclasticum sp.]MDY6290256.1 pyridoxal phosphate-dependent aminotransferase [Succiniclasticum sp.]